MLPAMTPKYEERGFPIFPRGHLTQGKIFPIRFVELPVNTSFNCSLNETIEIYDNTYLPIFT
jgi:hypothetical protein